MPLIVFIDRGGARREIRAADGALALKDAIESRS